MDHLDELNPCRGCLNRFVGCHAQCEKYAEWRRELERVKALKKQNYERYDTFDPHKDKLKRRRWR